MKLTICTAVATPVGCLPLGGGSSTLGIVALAVATVALGLAGAGLLGGKRSLA
jgi:hypothetical protein